MATEVLTMPMATVPSSAAETKLKAYDNSNHEVRTTLDYYKASADGKPPIPIYVGKESSYNAYSSFPYPITIHAVNGKEHEYTLDNNGFQFVQHQSNLEETDFRSQESIIGNYYPEVVRLLKNLTGATRVFIFNHTVRGQPGGVRNRAPYVKRVHIDQAYTCAANRVRFHLEDEATSLLKGRYQALNIWRPIRTIHRDPFAVADALSIPDSDCVTIELIEPESTGYTLVPLPKDTHKWYYCHEQRPDQVLLFKTWDSMTDGRARRVPHASFTDPRALDGPPRESIEVRAFIFHPDDTT